MLPIIITLLFGLILSTESASIAESPSTAIFPASCEMNILIVLDRSDSVLGGFNRSRDFVVEASDELNIGPNGHRMAMIMYSGLHYKRQIFPWNFAKSNADFRRITYAVRPIGGTTATGKALEDAWIVMQQRDTSLASLIMVVTDGGSQDDPKFAAEQLRQIPNTWVFAAATGQPEFVDKQELLDITGDIDRVVMQTGRDLAIDITKKLLRSVLDMCKNRVTGCELDLVLVMDFSTTTNPIYTEYQVMAEKLINGIRIGPGYTRVALILFSGVRTTRTVFDLAAYNTADEVITAIRRLRSAGGLTAVGEGIRIGLEQVTRGNGARPDAKQAMIVFTDGWNNKGPDPEEMANSAKAQGLQIYVVGHSSERVNGFKVNKKTLSLVANDQSNIYNGDNFDQLIERLQCY